MPRSNSGTMIKKTGAIKKAPKQEPNNHDSPLITSLAIMGAFLVVVGTAYLLSGGDPQKFAGYTTTLVATLVVIYELFWGVPRRRGRDK